MTIQPITSMRAKNAAYVVVWLWNVARDKRDRPHGVRIGPVANPRADEWSCDCHLRHLAERGVPECRPNGYAGVKASSEVWTKLANTFALQATDRSRPAASPAKKGFDVFPVTAQPMILVASECEEDGQMRSRPVELYVEVMGLANAAHFAHHLHHHQW